MAMHNRSNRLFAGSLRAGQRAATIMSLIQSTKSTRTIRIATSKTSSSACRPSPPVDSKSFFRTADSPRRPATSQDALAGRLLSKAVQYRTAA
jgi:hypothetical protein